VARHRAAAEWDRLYRLPADLWRALLADPETIERYHSKVYRRLGPGCWYWFGAMSSTGHGRLRCGTRALDPERPATRVMASHVYGFQLSRGLLPPDPATGLLPVIATGAMRRAAIVPRTGLPARRPTMRRTTPRAGGYRGRR
jgi:hypothetical protein